MAALAEVHPHEEITPIPPARRTLGGLEIGVLWGDLGVGLLVLVAGAFLVPALGLRAAILATVIGSVIGSALLAIAGRVGSDTGVPTMVALRPALGIRGSYLASVLNIGQLVGWAGLEIIIMAQASGAISDHFFGFDGYYVWLAAFAVIGTAFANPLAVTLKDASPSSTLSRISTCDPCGISIPTPPRSAFPLTVAIQPPNYPSLYRPKAQQDTREVGPKSSGSK